MEGVGRQAFPVTLVALLHVFSSKNRFGLKEIAPNSFTYCSSKSLSGKQFTFFDIWCWYN